MDPLSAPPAELMWEPVVVETETSLPARAKGGPFHEVILFASEGYMYQLYIAGPYELDDFPNPDIFEPPTPYPGAEADGEE